MKLVLVPEIFLQISIARGMKHAFASEVGIYCVQLAHFAHAPFADPTPGVPDPPGHFDN